MQQASRKASFFGARAIREMEAQEDAEEAAEADRVEHGMGGRTQSMLLAANQYLGAPRQMGRDGRSAAGGAIAGMDVPQISPTAVKTSLSGIGPHGGEGGGGAAPHAGGGSISLGLGSGSGESTGAGWVFGAPNSAAAHRKKARTLQKVLSRQNLGKRYTGVEKDARGQFYGVVQAAYMWHGLTGPLSAPFPTNLAQTDMRGFIPPEAWQLFIDNVNAKICGLNEDEPSMPLAEWPLGERALCMLVPCTYDDARIRNNYKKKCAMGKACVQEEESALSAACDGQLWVEFLPLPCYLHIGRKSWNV